MNRARGLLLLAMLLPPSWGCTGADSRAPGATAVSLQTGPLQSDTATLELGRKVYNFRCYFCHGYSGDARTLAATYLTPAPRDFTQGDMLSPEMVLEAVRGGRAGTAMKSFRNVLSDSEMEAVSRFVAREFVRDKARNTRYHTAENGWPDHDRYIAAFPFATGAIKLDVNIDTLDAKQVAGRKMFMSACISCHDRGLVDDPGPTWSSRPVSYPRMGFVPGQLVAPAVDAVSSASVYNKHEFAPKLAQLGTLERAGEALYQANCAFCHGADGTGKNWIGQFMEPKARDLTLFTVQSLPAAQLRQTIRDGLPGTSMPAWGGVLEPSEIESVGAYVARAFMRPDRRSKGDH